MDTASIRPLDALLQAPAVAGLFRRLAGPAEPPLVRAVALAESAADLEQTQRGTLAILSRAASADATGYRLDLAVRAAGSRPDVVVVLTDGREQVPATAASLAERTGVSILSAAPEHDLAQLATTAERELGGGAEAALATVERAVAALEQAEAADCDADELLEEIAAAAALPLALRPPEDGDVAVQVVVDGEAEGTLCLPDGSGHDAVAGRAVAQLAAAAVGRARTAQRRHEDIPIRSRSELLTEFLLAPHGAGDALLARMRAADLAVDGWHGAVRVEVDNIAELADDDELRSFQLFERIGRLSLEAGHAAGGVWHRAQLGSAVLLVRMRRSDPGARGAQELTAAAELVLRRLAARMPELQLVCGVGTVHVGNTGLRATVAEARAAVAAGRAARRFNAVTSFDEVGLQRTLLEWYASDSAREAVDALLRPLDRLGDDKRDVAIETLRVYLDNEGSLVRTAEALHLHRNAVAYRVRRILETLGIDGHDPDTRLMLQLACRARSLG